VVTGAGPIGLLAALMGCQRGLDVIVFDQVTSGPKPALVADMGATYRSEGLSDAATNADVILECTGVSSLVLDVLGHSAADGIVCFTGVSSGGRTLEIDAGMVNRSLVLGNNVAFGSVNANRRHYEAAADTLARADRSWLARLITRQVPVEQFADALARRPDDVKPIIQFSPAG
jgi:threonine dehydrogenase-like Zn-dependent dehydrogenase